MEPMQKHEKYSDIFLKLRNSEMSDSHCQSPHEQELSTVTDNLKSDGFEPSSTPSPKINLEQENSLIPIPENARLSLKAPLEARAPQVSLNRKAERHLSENARELRLIDGTIRGAQTLLFTSCFDGEGKSTAALNAVFGLAGGSSERVLLVDANLSKPKLNKVFSTQRRAGLSDILIGRTAIEDTIHPTNCKELDFIPAGVSQNKLGESIQTEGMSEFIAIVKDSYDYVVVVGSSIFNSSGPTRMSSIFDGLVLVTACEHTKWEVVQSAEEKISASGGTILGVVLNKRKFYIPQRIYQWLSG